VVVRESIIPTALVAFVVRRWRGAEVQKLPAVVSQRWRMFGSVVAEHEA
jgi:hypothetical protein